MDLTLLLCEQYFPAALFIMLYKVDLTFESVDEILKCHRSNESYWAFFPVVLFITLVAQGGSIFFNGLGNVLMCAIIQTKAVEHYAPLVLFTMLYT